MESVRVALVGCGSIADRMHLPGLAQMASMGLVELVAVADSVEAKAVAAAERYQVPRYETDLETLLESVEFDLLVNSTIIPAHYGVTLAALRAGRHVYTQKPMAATLDQARALVEAAGSAGRLLCSAPDYPARDYILEVRRIVEAGEIGTVSFAIVRTSHGGPETFINPNAPRDPRWCYQPGGGPLADEGVHGLSQITSILGPIKRVSAVSGRTLPSRRIPAGPLAGERFDVAVDDASLLLLEFGVDTFAFLDATYCVHASRAPKIEVFGSEGTISIWMPFADAHDVKVERYHLDCRDWQDVDVPPPPPVRDLGVLHMVRSILDGRPPLLTPEHALHIVEVLEIAARAAQSRSALEVDSSFT